MCGLPLRAFWSATVFTVEDDNDQVVRRFETSAEFEGFMQEVDMQRKQFQQDQSE
jgi:hypothetical protein